MSAGNLEIKLLNSNLKTIISLEDTNLILAHEWSIVIGLKGNVYAKTYTAGNINGTLLHHLILPLKGGFEVDHKDNSGLNNTRENLRYATHSQNMANSQLALNNTSGYKGVSWDNNRQLFQVGIKVKGKRIALGRYSNIEQAAEAYNKAARYYFGEFGYQNIIKETR